MKTTNEKTSKKKKPAKSRKGVLGTNAHKVKSGKTLKKGAQTAPENAPFNSKSPEDVPKPPQDGPKKENYDELLAKLSEKHARFVEEYLIDLNATKAAIRTGYTQKTALKASYRLLEHLGIKAAIVAGKEEISKRLRINQDEVIKELCRVGFARITDYVTFDSDQVSIKPSAELTDDQVAAISEVSDVSIGPFNRTIKFKLHNKVSALVAVLERVKPGADEPQKHVVQLTNMPPEPKTMAEWEALVKSQAAAAVTGS